MQPPTDRRRRTARADVINNARGYAALLRQHIQKENGILFPMADQVIPSRNRRRLPKISSGSSTRRPAKGSREVSALAEALEREAGA